MTLDSAEANLANANAQLQKEDQAALAYAKVTFERNKKTEPGETWFHRIPSTARKPPTTRRHRAGGGINHTSIMQNEASLQAREFNLAYTNCLSQFYGTVVCAAVDATGDRREFSDSDIISDRAGPHQDKGRRGGPRSDVVR